MVKLHTSLGTITLELDAERAPETVKNFLAYVEGGHYANTLFHRVIDGFMIQGGDPQGTGRGGPGYTIKDEFHKDLRHTGPGVLSMANAGPNTGGSQFFVTLAATPWLDNKHAVFGEVKEGLDVVQKIGSTRTGPGDRPVTEQKINSITIG
jgi:cyclophilin family peptidyl-prolyl cis-trans isomerase